MLDDDHGVALVDQSLKHPEQLADVLEVQPGGRFIQDVDGPAGGATLQLGGELDALGLTAGERGGRLAQAHVPQPHLDQGVEMAGDDGGGGEELGRLMDGHVQDVGDRLVLVTDLQGLPVVAGAVADLAGDVDVGQEVHLDLERAVALAGLAAPTLDVEGEAPGPISPNLRLGHGREDLADVVPHTGVGGGIGPGRAPDR